MVSKSAIQREALNRQGTTFYSISGNQTYFFPGNQQRADFEAGSEGIVQLAENTSTNIKYRIKSFWEPDESRFERSWVLAHQGLADTQKTYADVLGGAPVDILYSLGEHTPFAVVMKNIDGQSWKNLRDEAEKAANANEYPLPTWPALKIRASWAYGLVTSVKMMESVNFIHGDLSPGNVMVKTSGSYAGDIALVDFDSFIHPAWPTLHRNTKGSEGYASPELWNNRGAKAGSDRIGMAILIQEFLLTGEVGLTFEETFQWAYHQEDELSTRTAEAHPKLKEKWPDVAELVEQTLRAATVEARPNPDIWRNALRKIIKEDQNSTKRKNTSALTTSSIHTQTQAEPSSRVSNIYLYAHPIKKTNMTAMFAAFAQNLDLLQSCFGIRATLERNNDGKVFLVVHFGAEIRVKFPSSNSWTHYSKGERILLVSGMLVFDQVGKSTALLSESVLKENYSN